MKAGEDVFLWNRDEEEVPSEALRRHFVHLDGFMRIPVLIAGNTAVRGFDSGLYTEVFSSGVQPGEFTKGS